MLPPKTAARAPNPFSAPFCSNPLPFLLSKSPPVPYRASCTDLSLSALEPPTLSLNSKKRTRSKPQPFASSAAFCSNSSLPSVQVSTAFCSNTAFPAPIFPVPSWTAYVVAQLKKKPTRCKTSTLRFLCGLLSKPLLFLLSSLRRLLLNPEVFKRLVDVPKMLF